MDLQDARTPDPAVPGSGVGRSRSLPLLLSRYAVHRLLVPGLDNGLWLAWDLHRRQRVAVRAIHDAGGTDTAVFSSAAGKLDALRAMARDSVARLIDTGVDSSGLFFVFEHFDNPTLFDLVTREGPMKWEYLAPLAHQLLATLKRAHGLDIVHGRLAPWRCAIAAHPVGPSVRLLELAGTMAARTIVRAERRRLDDLLGPDVACLAPELLRGNPPDVRTDVYGVGLLLYFALTGKIPFLDGKTTPRDVMAKAISEPPVAIRHWSPSGSLPESIEQAILWSLAKDPRHRFESLNELAQALDLEQAPPVPSRSFSSDIRARVERARPGAAASAHPTKTPSEPVEAEAITLPATAMDVPLARQLAATPVQHGAPQANAATVQHGAPQATATPMQHGAAQATAAPGSKARANVDPTSGLAEPPPPSPAATSEPAETQAHPPRSSEPSHGAPAHSPAGSKPLPEFPGRSLTPDALVAPPSRPTGPTQTLLVGSNEIVVRLAEMREHNGGAGNRRHRVTQVYETVELTPASAPPAAVPQSARSNIQPAPASILDVPAGASTPYAPMPFVRPPNAESYVGRMTPWPKGEGTTIEPDIAPIQRPRTLRVLLAMVLLAICIAIPAVLVANNGGLGLLGERERTVVDHRRAGLGISGNDVPMAGEGTHVVIPDNELRGRITVFTPARTRGKLGEGQGAPSETGDRRSFEGPAAVADPQVNPTSPTTGESSSFPSLDTPEQPKPKASSKPKPAARAKPKKVAAAYPEMVELSDIEEATLARAIRGCVPPERKSAIHSALVHFSPTTGRPVRIDLGYPPQRDRKAEDCIMGALGSSFRRDTQPAGEIARVEL